MKLSVTILVILLPAVASAQSMTGYVKAEQTVNRINTEVGIGYQSRSSYVAGAFVQGRPAFRVGESNFEDFYYGAFAMIPVFKSQQIIVYGDLHAGIINGNYFIITPQLITRITVSKTTALGFGSGLRYGYPSASVSVSCHLINPRKK